MYELKDYLKAINQTKEKLLDTEDEEWVKKYSPFTTKKIDMGKATKAVKILFCKLVIFFQTPVCW